MAKIEKIKVSSGVYWIGIPEANLFVLCGCPADSVKHLMKRGLIKTVEENDFSFETGPNAILLSDALIQHGHFSNLAEFPVLQMLYRQGMLLPGHPNNTGEKPLLLGGEEQIKAQMAYIYRGNYGLTTKEELMHAGVPETEALQMMQLKRKFAFGAIRKSEELLNSVIIKEEAVEIKNHVFCQRVGFNHYLFQYGGDTVEVNLNLDEEEEYEPPYELGFYKVIREYFAVIHSGAGNGWDVNRPSMSSILIFHGKVYLIDAGPNIMHSLTALGISVNEVEGIFHTHAHDDHFCGLTTLIRSDHRIKYYTTPLVRASVVKKLSALLSWDEDKLSLFFDIYDLEMDVWNNIEGLEVKPSFSPHPVETNIFNFRVLWEDGYRTYAHLADIATFKVLKEIKEESIAEKHIPPFSVEEVMKNYLAPVDIKKIDIGGGLIHGEAEDFKEDTSEKIIFSHKSSKLSVKEKEIGSDAPFGTVDILISANQDYTMRNASELLKEYFKDIPLYDFRMLLNCEVVTFNAGSILLKKGKKNPDIFLILTGITELIRSETSTHNLISSGYMVGEISGLTGTPSAETFRAASYVRALRIPNKLYQHFVMKNNLYHDIEKVFDNRAFLQDTSLFGEMLSYPVQNKIAQAIQFQSVTEGETLTINEKPELILLEKGSLCSCHKENPTEINTLGDFLGEESVLQNDKRKRSNPFEVCAKVSSTFYRIPGDILMDIPVILWKLLEVRQKRFQGCKC